ncbi:MAG: hypothetical protein KatS3mg114_1031 [Planctomycetaceae bacterium]|nr:MAG: hypothetical protein KatS3mg114_1031 [Planctomycetaceae bacterium]
MTSENPRCAVPAEMLNRRCFHAQLAVILGSLAVVDDEKKSAQKPTDQTTSRPPRLEGEHPPLTLAELRLAQLVLQYPSPHFTPEVLAELLTDIRADIARAQRLQAFSLANHDPPSFLVAAPGVKLLALAPHHHHPHSPSVP